MANEFIKSSRGRRSSVSSVLVLVVAVAACGEVPSSPRKTAQSQNLQKAGQVAANGALLAAVAGRTGRGAEDDLLRLEADLPELGGGYFDEVGRFVVLLTDMSRGSAAKILARRHISGWQMGDAMRNTFAVQGEAGVVIQPAQYRFSSLVAWHGQVRAALPITGVDVSGLDADERHNRLLVSVVDETQAPLLLQILTRMGIPQNAISIDQRPYAQGSVSNLRDYKRPTGAGIQIATSVPKRCSLGWNVTDGQGRIGFLTAGHCLYTAMGQGTTGTIFGQPAINDPIGAVVINPVWNYTGPGCSGQAMCTQADILFAEYTSSAYSQRRLARTEYYGANNAKGSITFNAGFSWYNNLFYPYVAYVGASVDKVGRSTGWTRGGVTNTCYDAVVTTWGIPYGVPCMTIVENARHGQGDSGGPVFNSTSLTFDHVEPLGVYIGGWNMTVYDYDGFFYCASECRYLFNNWAQIQSHLGTTLTVSNP